MVSWRHTCAAKWCFLILLAVLVQQLRAHSAEEKSASYIQAYGQHTALAVRLAELIEAEEPLRPEDVARLAAAVKKACSSGAPAHEATHHLGVSDLLKQYGKEPGVLDNRALEQACTAIMACQLDESCNLQPEPAVAATDSSGTHVTGLLRLIAALALFVEGLLGVYIPVLLRSVEGYEWWLSLLNCFSGGVFLAAGLVHLLPHCQESQARLGALVGEYPLYLVLITLGYMLVLFVERVLFDVHGSAHGHGPHTGIAPPCVDCITAEAVVEHTSHISLSHDASGEAPDTPSSPPPAAVDVSSQVLVASVVSATPRATSRTNLRSRGQAAAATAPGLQPPSSEGLLKPLLAETTGVGAAEACGGSGHGHHHHHGHNGHLGGGSGHGGHAAHVPHHHHAVVTGDLKQGVVLLVAMSVHTFLECMALGLMDMRKEFLMLFMAIASHKLISGLALSSRFLKEGATTRQITLCVGPFTFVAPCAILVGMFVADVNPLVHLALSCFATGTFLYVGASEIVEEEFEGDMRSGRTDISQAFARWAKFAMLLLGVAAIALLSLVPDAHDHGHGGHTHSLGSHHHHSHHHHH